MKAVHLSTSDLEGGAARAAFRLHHALLGQGVDARMLVMKKSTDAPTVASAAWTWTQKARAQVSSYLDPLPTRIWPREDPQALWSPAWLPGFPVHRLPQVAQAQVITLFWVEHGFLSPRTIGRLLRLGKPVLWRLSDMWPFTGGCHYSGDCRGYEGRCGRCPQLGGVLTHDLSRWVWHRKHRWWKNRPFTVISPSAWMAASARSSSLFREARIEVIPGGVNVGIFKKIDRQVARSILQLPPEAPLILFGAFDAWGDRRKGGHFLKEALEIMSCKLSVPKLPQLVIFGSWQKPEIPQWDAPVHVMGRLQDEPTLALLYNACEVFVAPSVQDNFPNTVLEALACGTPCVAFRTSGLPELIAHERQGYLARPFDPYDLARGIAWVLEDEDRQRRLSQQAREKAVQEFSLEEIAKRYLALYRETME